MEKTQIIIFSWLVKSDVVKVSRESSRSGKEKPTSNQFSIEEDS